MPWVNEERGLKYKRVTDSANPLRKRIVATLSPLHHESVVGSGNYDVENDLSPARVNNAQLNGWVINTNGWHFAYQGFPSVGAQPQEGTVAYGGRQGQHWLGLRPFRIGYLHWNTRTPEFIGGAPTFSTPTLVQKSATIGQDATWNINTGFEATIDNLWTTPGGGSAKWVIKANSGRLKQDIVINQAARDWITTNAPPSTPAPQTWFGVVFELEWRDIPRARLQGQLQNILNGDFEDTGTLELEDLLGNKLGFFAPAHIYCQRSAPDAPRGGRVDVRKRFYFDGSSWFLFVGANIRDINRNLLPGDLVIDPPITQENIAANSDDASQFGTNMALSGYNNRLYVGEGGFYGNYNIGLRFQTIPIANASTINSASITVYREVLSGSPSMLIHCEDVDDAATFTTGASNITNRTPTTASTTWNSSFGAGNNQDVTSPDIASAVEEVIARGGWSSNNDLVVLLLENTGSATNLFAFQDFSSAGSNEARFDASYTAAGGATPFGSRPLLLLGVGS